MTPKEKSKELIGKYAFYTITDFSDENFEQTKQCALIAVDEILKCIVPKDDDERYAFELCGNQFYWQEVKEEIEKL
jgi:hypothetical protein